MSMSFVRALRALVLGLAVLTVTALLALACESDGEQPTPTATVAAGETPTQPPQLEKIAASTTWFMLPHFSPLALAKERGYFEEEGLDVTIHQGGPGTVVFALLDDGTYDFLFGASLDSLPEAVGQGFDVKAVAAVTHGTPAVIIFRADSDIQDFKDLEGKTIGIEVGGGIHTKALPDLLAANGVDVETITFREVEARVRTALLLEGQIDAMTAHRTTVVEIGSDADVRFLPIADLDIDYLSGIGIMTKGTTITERPEVVRGFVRAMLRAWADASENRQDSVDAGAQLFPEHYLDNDAAVGQLETQLAATETADTEVHGIGYMAEEEWQTLVDLLVEYTEFEDPAPVETYYTNEFLPDPPIMLP